ncbi:MAG: NUDIX hydrolase [Streptosporangiales bacterium]
MTVEYPSWLRPLVEAAPTVRPADLRRHLPPPEGGRKAAVLILFGETVDGPDVLLVQRSDDLRAHAGQPAFPGGALDAGDRDAAAAALREAEEETGLDPAGVEIVAALPELFVSVSGYAVTPLIGWWRKPTPVHAVDPAETALVARVPVAELADPANRLRIRHPSGRVGPAFRVRGMTVWGFTGGLLDRVLALGGWERPWSRSRVETL